MPLTIAPAGAAGKWDLLYVSNGSGTVTVYRYWLRTLHQVLTGFRSPKGECVDRLGDVYITDARLKKIFEYQHGGAKPIKVLSDPGYVPYGCSISPATGDLAVANYSTTGRGAGDIAIYRHANGKPKFYPPIRYAPSPISCGYDDRGNLFVASLLNYSGYLYASFAYLPKRSVTFVKVILSNIGSSGPFDLVSGLQWDGKYWAVEYEGSIQQYSIDRQGNATYQGETGLYYNNYSPGQFWITNFRGGSGQGNQIVTVEQYSYYERSSENIVRYWKYPAGGNSTGSITDYLNEPYGVTVSLAPNK